MVDKISFTIVCGLMLIVLYYIKYKEMPHLEAALVLIIGGESMIYGLSLIAYTLTEKSIYFIDSRLTLTFGGYALVWIGLEAYKKHFKDMQYEIHQILEKNNGKMSLEGISTILFKKHVVNFKNINKLNEVIKIMEIRKIIKITEGTECITAELLTSKTWADEYRSK